MKKYYENRFIRILSWPRTTLFGNQFHVSFSGYPNSYFIEKPTASRSTASRIFAGILYPFVNPITFVIRAINNQSKEFKDIQKSINNNLKEAENLQEKDLEKMHEANVNESAKELIDRFNEQENLIRMNWANLRDKIKTTDAWNKDEFKNEFNIIFSQASANFILLLKGIEKVKNEEKISSSRAIVERLVDQKGDKYSSGMAYLVTRATFLDMYHHARSRMAPKEYKEPGKIFAKKYRDYDRKILNHDHQNAALFYKDDMIENKWRQLYNKNINLFFGMSNGLDDKDKFKNTLREKDQRFTEWLHEDPTIQEDKDGKFLLFPMRPSR